MSLKLQHNKHFQENIYVIDNVLNDLPMSMAWLPLKTSMNAGTTLPKCHLDQQLLRVSTCSYHIKNMKPVPTKWAPSHQVPTGDMAPLNMIKNKTKQNKKQLKRKRKLSGKIFNFGPQIREPSYHTMYY